MVETISRERGPAIMEDAATFPSSYQISYELAVRADRTLRNRNPAELQDRLQVVGAEASEVLGIGSAKAVDGLIGIADRAEGTVGRRQQANQPVLGGVDVLVLVHQQVATALARITQDLLGFA